MQPDPLGAYTLGEYVNIGLSVHDSVCTIYVDDVAEAEGKLTGPAAKTSYFKAGVYTQANNRQEHAEKDGYGEAYFRSIELETVPRS